MDGLLSDFRSRHRPSTVARHTYWPHNPGRSHGGLVEAGMVDEDHMHLHIYEDWTAVKHLVVDTSKLHDWMNSWNYSADGLYLSRGVVIDNAFQLYSFAGMAPAAAVTAAGVFDRLPIERRLTIYAH